MISQEENQSIMAQSLLNIYSMLEQDTSGAESGSDASSTSSGYATPATSVENPTVVITVSDTACNEKEGTNESKQSPGSNTGIRKSIKIRTSKEDEQEKESMQKLVKMSAERLKVLSNSQRALKALFSVEKSSSSTGHVKTHRRQRSDFSKTQMQMEDKKKVKMLHRNGMKSQTELSVSRCEKTDSEGKKEQGQDRAAGGALQIPQFTPGGKKESNERRHLGVDETH